MPLEKWEAANINGEYLNSVKKCTDMAKTNMKASLLSFRFTYNSYNSLISQILQLANDNPSFCSSIRILKVLFTDRKCFALIAAYLNHWISGKNQKQLFRCLYSFPHLMPLKDWRSKLRRIYALLCAAEQLALSSLRIDASKCHFKDCLSCYGSSLQQNAVSAARY